MPDIYKLAISLTIFVCTVLCYRALRTSRRNLPPGPKPLPLIGNVLQLPRHQSWRTFAKWGDTYGDVVHMRLFGKNVVILNSYEAVHDLMVQRSLEYADRPQRVMGDLCGYNLGLLFVGYGDRWRKLRRLVHDQVSGRQTAVQYQSIQEAEAKIFLARLLETPNRFVDHIRRYAGSVILQITYGYAVSSDDDPLVVLAEEVLRNISETMTHGAFIVEILPMLRHVPAWTPFLGRFLKIAGRWHKNLDDFTDIPYYFAKGNMERGVGPHTFVSNALSASESSATEEEEELLRSAASSLYAGGADTAVSIMCSFFLAMALHPGVQEKAHEEISRVIGENRLPRFPDRDSLPYVDCIAQECLRWNPVANLVTHATPQDNMYRDFFIPAGSYVVGNIWAITHNEKIYPDPHRFFPERFMRRKTDSAENPHPRNFVFGFGRRGCPGQDVAEASLWIQIATTLAMFRVSKAKDAHGMEITPEVEYTSKSFSHPKPFPCEIEPRSAQALKVLQELE